MTDSEIKELLKLAAQEDFTDMLGWTADLQFYINCSDVFAWGCSDCEDINNAEDIVLLKKAIEGSDCIEGPHLYCARKRQMRPQGAVYKHIKEKFWPLYDECGPPREVGFGNPHKHPNE